jgi:hypothetical protein
MIIEDKRNTDYASDIEYEQINEAPYVQISHEHTLGFLEFIERHVNTTDDQTHSQLQSEFIVRLFSTVQIGRLSSTGRLSTVTAPTPTSGGR